MEQPRPSTESADTNGAVAPEAMVGRTYYRYKCLRVLGKGAMATVLLGEDIALKRPVAIKLLAHENKANPSHRVWLDQFVREARAAARLTHPGIVQVYDIGIHEGYLYIAMEAMLGGSLEQLVRGAGPLPCEQAVAQVRQAAEALAFAHQRGVLHRDVKPANLLLSDDGQCKLGDFGLAICDDPKDTFKLPDNFLGTPYFLAPEVLLNLGGPAADVYALGATLWFLLTGRYPYPVKKLRDVLKVGRQIPLGDLRALCPAAGDDLAALLAKSLARKPEDRYSDAGEMLAALEGLGEQGELTALAIAVRGRNAGKARPQAFAAEAEDAVPMARPAEAAPASRARPEGPAQGKDVTQIVVGVVLIACALAAVAGMAVLAWQLMAKPEPVSYVDRGPDPDSPEPPRAGSEVAAFPPALPPPAPDTQAANTQATTAPEAPTPAPRQTQPRLVTQGNNGRIQLPAAKAGLDGGGVTLETKPKPPHVVWTDANSRVLWEVHVKKPGDYEVTANVAAASPVRLVLTMAGESIEAEVPATGSVRKFTSVPLGRITIPRKGPVGVKVIAAKTGFAPIRIAAVAFKKIK